MITPTNHVIAGLDLHRAGPRRLATNSQCGGCFGSLGAEPPAAGGQWGLGAPPPAAGGWESGSKAPAAGGKGVWGRSPQRSKILHFFAKIT